MKHRNQISTDHHRSTRKGKVNTELQAQMQAYAQAWKEARANGTKPPHIDDYVTSVR